MNWLVVGVARVFLYLHNHRNRRVQVITSNNGSFKFAWNGIASWRSDKIIALSDGKIVERGTHRQLLRESELYAQMWVRQSSGFGSDLDESR